MMAHRHKPRRNKTSRQLIAMEQGKPAIAILNESGHYQRQKEGNLVPRLNNLDTLEIQEIIRRRYDSAEATTIQVSKEIERAERQFKGLFPLQKEWEDVDDDDVRIFMRKTMEHIQIVYSHLDGLTAQLKPLLVFQPAVSGLRSPELEFERAKVKEMLVNFYLDKNRFKKDVLTRWRWNFLKHPSAFLRVVYEQDKNNPDIRIDVVDRGMLYFDPTITTGDIKDAAWVIERGLVTRDEALRNIEEGYWHVNDEYGDLSNLFAPPQDEAVLRLLGANIGSSNPRGPEQDNLVEVFHYWQAETRGEPHAYGVVLGGKDGQLVRWGPNPYPYKGIPYRGKSYMRDPYKPDGISLAMQYRSIQEVYNTFFNLRIEDVLENVKQRYHVFENMFNETTKEDHEKNQKYVRFSKDFFQQIMDSGKSMQDFMLPPQSGDSTAHLLGDLAYLGQEGRAETSINDAFRGQNPQSGATLGQVQENLVRSLGVFRSIFAQEMTLCEEIGEIIDVYFSDEDFFGPERLISFVGENRYKNVISDFYSDAKTGVNTRRVFADEMDVDVTIDVLSQADHLASKTLRMQQQDVFFESLRHHPEMAKEAAEVINFPALLRKRLEDMGEDIEAITFTPEEKQQRLQRKQAELQAHMQQQAQATGMVKQAEERAKGQREMQVAQAKAQVEASRDNQLIMAENKAAISEIIAKVNAENRSAMAEMLQDHQLRMQRMILEAGLEIQAAKAGSNVSVQTGGNSINK